MYAHDLTPLRDPPPEKFATCKLVISDVGEGILLIGGEMPLSNSLTPEKSGAS